MDLAATMIAIALGEPLPFDADEPRAARPRDRVPRLRRGPARAASRPRPGLITRAAAAAGPGRAQRRGRRGGLGRADRLRPDARQARSCTRADRAQAIARLARALAEYEIAGVETTLPLFRALVARSPSSRAGDFDVQWLDRRLADGLCPASAPAAGGRRRSRRPGSRRRGARRRRRRGGRRRRPLWRRRGAAARRCGADGDAPLRSDPARTRASREELALEIDGGALRADARRRDAASAARSRACRTAASSLLLEDGRQICGRARPGGDGEVEVIDAPRPAPRRASPSRCATGSPHAGRQPARMPARRRSGRSCPAASSRSRVAAGDRVEPGALLLVLEAMKMQNEIRAVARRHRHSGGCRGRAKRSKGERLLAVVRSEDLGPSEHAVSPRPPDHRTDRPVGYPINRIRYRDPGLFAAVPGPNFPFLYNRDS